MSMKRKPSPPWPARTSQWETRRKRAGNGSQTRTTNNTCISLISDDVIKINIGQIRNNVNTYVIDCRRWDLNSHTLASGRFWAGLQPSRCVLLWLIMSQNGDIFKGNCSLQTPQRVYKRTINRYSCVVSCVVFPGLVYWSSIQLCRIPHVPFGNNSSLVFPRSLSCGCSALVFQNKSPSNMLLLT